MSIDNSELLMLLGGKKSKSTIGKAGQQGFGVGVYGGDPTDLTAMGLTPMKGCGNPSSENYGNYIHTNGSVMVFIPAFCYRSGNQSAPSYSRDAENALEIRDASLGEGDGWILHRAFIDGGQQKLGFFIDKYVCSKDSTGKKAISVKNADPISLYTGLSNSLPMPGCEGTGYDAITLGRARGDQYSCVTAFQWSAISMLSLAHGQAATSSQFCGWYDANHTTNFPKGNNNGSLKDTNDSSITFTAHSQSSAYCKTGSGKPFNKTTHNGQNCGISDVNGNQCQLCLGLRYNNSTSMYVMKESVRAHDFTKDNRSDTGFFDYISSVRRTNGWGSNAFYTNTSGTERALCGVIPKTDSSKIAIFGNDYLRVYPVASDAVFIVGGIYNDTSDAGVWFRYFYNYYWRDSRDSYGFRCSGYAS